MKRIFIDRIWPFTWGITRVLPLFIFFTIILFLFSFFSFASPSSFLLFLFFFFLLLLLFFSFFLFLYFVSLLLVLDPHPKTFCHSFSAVISIHLSISWNVEPHLQPMAPSFPSASAAVSSFHHHHCYHYLYLLLIFQSNFLIRVRTPKNSSYTMLLWK